VQVGVVRVGDHLEQARNALGVRLVVVAEVALGEELAGAIDASVFTSAHRWLQ